MNYTTFFSEGIKTPLLVNANKQSEKAKNTGTPNQGKINILYVDDDDISLLIFKTIFKNRYNIFTCLNTAKAREILAKENIDIIVSDHYMPDETGKDFFRSIKTSHADKIKILLTSHASTMGYISNALKSGEIWAHVIKPVEDKELIKTLKRAEKTIYTQRKQNNSLSL